MAGPTARTRPFPVLPADGRLLFAARAARLFAYGFLSVVLVLYLAELGLDEARIGLLLSLTCWGIRQSRSGSQHTPTGPGLSAC